MSNQLIQEITTHNDAENIKNENTILTLSLCDETRKESKKRAHKEKNSKDLIDGVKTKELVQINTGFKIEPQTLWVQYTDDGGGGGFDYDPETRNSFIKLVLIIVFIMLALTGGFTAIVYTTESLREFFLKHSLLLSICSGVIMLALSYAVGCSACTRVPPCNIFVLVIALCAMSILCAAVTARYSTHIIIYALIATMATVFVCILLACSRFDFTKYLIYVIALSVAFGVVSMIASIAMFAMNQNIPVLRLVLLVVGTLLNVAMLIMELQMILGGKTVELNDSDYALAAFLLYTSIVNMFLQFIRMFGTIEDLLG